MDATAIIFPSGLGPAACWAGSTWNDEGAMLLLFWVVELGGGGGGGAMVEKKVENTDKQKVVGDTDRTSVYVKWRM